jgi:hypothetical protein
MVPWRPRSAPSRFARWPIDEVRGSFFSFPNDDSWSGQVEAMREWILARAAWLDGAL